MALRSPTIRSIVVAVVVGLLAPALWIVVTGETSRAPTVEKEFFEKMTDTERNKWMQNNAKPVTLWEHAKGVPQFIVDSWRGYLQASIAVFVVVFVLNSAFLSGGRREP